MLVPCGIARYMADRMTHPRLPLARLMMVFALFAALATSGFAHRAPPVAVDESLTAYLVAGGTLSDLCIDIGDEDAAVMQSCDACRLVDSIAVPILASGCHVVPTRIVLALGGRGASAPAQSVFDPINAARAPPVT